MVPVGLLRARATVRRSLLRRGDRSQSTGSRWQHHRSPGGGSTKRRWRNTPWRRLGRPGPLVSVSLVQSPGRPRCKAIAADPSTTCGPDTQPLHSASSRRSQCVAPVRSVGTLAAHATEWHLSDRLQAAPGTAANEWAVISTATTRLADGRHHAARHWTCSSSVEKLRSTPKWPCFTTFSVAMPTSVACEVTFYLAVASPSSSRPRSAGPAVSSWLTLHRARRRSPAGPAHGPSEHHSECRFGSRKPVAELHGRDPDVDHRTEGLVVLRRVRHRRGVTLADSRAEAHAPGQNVERLSPADLVLAQSREQQARVTGP